MKNLTVAITLGILLLSSALLVSIPNHIVAQEEETDEDYTMTKEEIKTKVTEFKTKHPKFVAIVEAISNLDLKETVKAYLSAEVLQNMLNIMLRI